MGMANLPDLHDGFFDGLWLSANDERACLFVRTEHGELSTIVLGNVEALNIRNVRAGNIIFDLVLTGPDALTVEHVERAYDLQREQKETGHRLLQKAQTLGLSALEMSTSYGAEGTALFRDLKVIPGHAHRPLQQAHVTRTRVA